MGGTGWKLGIMEITDEIMDKYIDEAKALRRLADRLYHISYGNSVVRKCMKPPYKKPMENEYQWEAIKAIQDYIATKEKWFTTT